MKKMLCSLFSQPFRILFIRRCYCCAFACVGLLVLHGAGVADKDIGGEPHSDLKAVELLMSADENFKKDNSPANRMALIKVLLTFEEKSLRIQAANHAKQLVRERPADPEAYTIYCRSAFLIKDDDMLQKGFSKLWKITSREDYERRRAEILDIEEQPAETHPGSGAVNKAIFTSSFLRFAAYGFAAWASTLAVLMLAGQALAERASQPNRASQHFHKSEGSDMRTDRQNWYKMLLKFRRFSIYCSIPITIALTAVIVTGLWHTFNFAGSIPLKQIVVFGMLVLASLVISICCLKEINR